MDGLALRRWWSGRGERDLDGGVDRRGPGDRRAARRLQEFIRTVELELKPTMLEAREAIRKLDRAAGARRIPSTGPGTFVKLEQAGENVRATTGKSARCSGRVSSRRQPLAA